MPTPKEISALASEMPTGGFSAGQIKDIAGSPNATSLIATSKDSRAALPAANTKLDAMIRAQQPSVSAPITTPTQTGAKTAKDVGLEGNTPSGGVGSKYTSGDGSKWVYTNGGWVPDTGVQNGAQGGSTGQNGANTVPQTPYEKELSDYAARLEEQKQTLLTADKEWQAKLDSTLSSLVDSIQKKYEARRLKMQDVNARNLEGKRISGITSGRMKYANTMEDNLLSTEELDGQARLAEIDAEEMTLIAQAKQARDEASYTAFYKNMDRLDALSKEKMDTITNLHNAAIAADKALDEKRRNSITEEQALFNLSQDKASSFAKTAYELMSTMKTDADKEAYLQKLAKDQKLDPEILRGAIDEYGGKQENLQSQIAARESAATAREANIALRETAQQIKEAGKNGGSPSSADKGFKLTQSQKSKIIALGGYSEKDINDMEAFVKEYGLDATLQGVPEKDRARLKSILGAPDSATGEKQFITPEYITQNIDDRTLKSLASSMGYRHFLSSWSTEKKNLTASDGPLMKQVEQYRTNGLTDKEIIELLTN